MFVGCLRSMDQVYRKFCTLAGPGLLKDFESVPPEFGHILEQADPHDMIPTSALLEVGLNPFVRRTSKSLEGAAQYSEIIETITTQSCQLCCEVFDVFTGTCNDRSDLPSILCAQIWLLLWF